MPQARAERWPLRQVTRMGFALNFSSSWRRPANSQLAERNVLGLGNMAGGELLVLAHVQNQRVVIVKTGGFQRVGLFDAGQFAADEGPDQHGPRHGGYSYQHPVLLQELNIHVLHLTDRCRA